VSSRHIARTVNYTDNDGVAQTLTVYEAKNGVRGGARGSRWYTCRQCRYDFPEDEIVLVNGAPYCTTNGCADEHTEG